MDTDMTETENKRQKRFWSVTNKRKKDLSLTVAAAVLTSLRALHPPEALVVKSGASCIDCDSLTTRMRSLWDLRHNNNQKMQHVRNNISRA